jgi:fructosamine-3-kinase
MYISNSIKAEITEGLCELLAHKPKVYNITPVSGGSINDSFKVDTSRGSYFIKANIESFSAEMFEKEVLGLNCLRFGCSLRVPEVIGSFKTRSRSYLILEWLEPAARAANYWELLGCGLAELHKQTNNSYGLDYNNFIGSLRQHNDYHASWVEFFIQHRLSPQLKLSLQQQLIDPDILLKFDALFEKLSALLPVERPALIHGDLWSGNIFQDEEGLPCLIDPAVYYGHREVDIAFSKLFGGFAPAFYEAYNSAFPLEQHFDERIDLYNLYPLLVHLNLFGQSYLGQIKSILQRFT